jgi:hypothetical protein
MGITGRRAITVRKYWEIIADNLSKAGWTLVRVSAVDSNGRTIFVADAHRGDGKRFVVHADEKLAAFVELESAIRTCGDCARQVSRFFQNSPLSNQCVRRPFDCDEASLSSPLCSWYSSARRAPATATPRPPKLWARGSPATTPSSCSGCTTSSAASLGADPERWQNSLVTDGYIPQGRALLCRKEWTQLNYGWSTLLEPYVTDSSKKETKAARQQAAKDLKDENDVLPAKIRQIRGGQWAPRGLWHRQIGLVHRVTDRVLNCVRFVVPQQTERHHITD